MSRAVPELIQPGMKFHSLTAVEKMRIDGRKGYFWRCKCDCGNDAIVYAGHLRAGSTKGCGCAKKGINRTHGKAHSPEYKAWDNARSRCYREVDRKFPLYGGRGIKMCDRWISSFANFFSDMGPRPEGYTLDRKDSDGDYEPGNCRWATPTQQNRNRPRFNRYVLLNGERITVGEASERTGIPHATILDRLNLKGESCLER